jgi:amino-acid N-acetyltransferase
VPPLNATPVALEAATARVRPAAIHDVPAIHSLLEGHAAQGNLLPRTMSELYRHLRDFFVVEVATGPSLDRDPRLDSGMESRAMRQGCRGHGLAPIGELEGKVVACAALEIFTEDLGEVRSLVVDRLWQGRGFGRELVERLIEEARAIGLKRLMALTYVADFFHKLGFRTVSKETLPEKVWSVCIKCYKYNHCDETAVLLDLRQRTQKSA